DPQQRARARAGSERHALRLLRVVPGGGRAEAMPGEVDRGDAGEADERAGVQRQVGELEVVEDAAGGPVSLRVEPDDEPGGGAARGAGAAGGPGPGAERREGDGRGGEGGRARERARGGRGSAHGGAPSARRCSRGSRRRSVTSGRLLVGRRQAPVSSSLRPSTSGSCRRGWRGRRSGGRARESRLAIVFGATVGSSDED